MVNLKEDLTTILSTQKGGVDAGDGATEDVKDETEETEDDDNAAA